MTGTRLQAAAPSTRIDRSEPIGAVPITWRVDWLVTKAGVGVVIVCEGQEITLRVVAVPVPYTSNAVMSMVWARAPGQARS